MELLLLIVSFYFCLEIRFPLFFLESKEMSICGARIKEIDTLSGILFKNLRELTLENNSITSIRGLSELSNLVVLKLNHNKIENFDDIFSLKISF